LTKNAADSNDLSKYLKGLLDDGSLDELRSFSSGVYSILGRSSENIDGVMCSIDPFCYLSHLSAMAYHGITNRLPVKFFISSPGPKDWKMAAVARMQADLKNDYEAYYRSGLPKLARTDIKRIRKTDIQRFNSKHLGAFKKIKGEPIRVSSIGRTFLDMLRNPELCGGINHVSEVFDEYAKKYLRLITDEIDQNGKPIDKIRAGYILEERLGLGNDTIEQWTEFAQRGSSRKLDASAEYMPIWSDKWLISINTFEKK
jgi:predicted transcriptional regulator of viral defense system